MTNQERYTRMRSWNDPKAASMFKGTSPEHEQKIVAQMAEEMGRNAKEQGLPRTELESIKAEVDGLLAEVEAGKTTDDLAFLELMREQAAITKVLEAYN